MKRRVAFIIHPYNVSVIRSNFKIFYPFFGNLFYKLVRKLSDYRIKIFFSNLQPHRFMEVTNIQSIYGNKIDFIGIMLPLFPEQFIFNNEMVLNKVIKSVKLAEKLGADIVTLGGFSSIIGFGGEEIAKHSSLAITSGNTYTAALCVEGIMKACRTFNKDMSNSTVGVIGATGDIGSICTKILAKNAKKLIICSRRINYEGGDLINNIKSYSNADIFIENDISKLLEVSDIVLTATSSPVDIIQIQKIKKGTIVCDVSIPPNISRQNDILSRNDIFIFDGGRAKLQYFDEIIDNKWRALFPFNSIFGCLAESLILAFEEKIVSYSLGRGKISEERIKEISLSGKKHGIELADFSLNNIFYSSDEINKLQLNN